MTSETLKLTEIIKLSQNENAYGTSPKALQAIKENYHEAFRYPDVFHLDLKQRIADKFKVKPENVIISAGSIALMDMSTKAFAGSDENIVTAEITFEGYRYMARVNRKECRLAKLVNNAINLNSIFSLCDKKTRLVFIANPNNPTGTMISHCDLERFLQVISSNTYVVSDEAYAEYVTDPDYPDTHKLQKTYPNLIIFRTFSKIYGLAGLRIGYAIAHPDVIKSLEQSKTPFSIGGLASAAAYSALDDDDYIRRCASENAEERLYLYNNLTSLGYKAVYPYGNFIYVDFDNVLDKENFYNNLESKKILIRKLDRFGVDRALRITVGRPEDNRFLISCLQASN